MKICTNCTIAKEGVAFYGTRAQCKECLSHKRKIYYKNNRERALSYNQKWSESNRELSNSYKKKYAMAHLEDIRIYKKNYDSINFDKNSLQKKNWRKKFPNYMNEYHLSKKKLYLETKDGPCMDCGLRFDSCAMDLDHRPNTIKLFNLSQWKCAKTLDEYKAELIKCDLVCSNCHRVRTKLRR